MTFWFKTCLSRSGYILLFTTDIFKPMIMTMSYIALVEQNHLSSTPFFVLFVLLNHYHFGVVHCLSFLSLFWSLYCFLFDERRLLITPLVSSNPSCLIVVVLRTYLSFLWNFKQLIYLNQQNYFIYAQNNFVEPFEAPILGSNNYTISYSVFILEYHKIFNITM